MSETKERLEKKLEQLEKQKKWLEEQWERDVRFAGPAAPNKRLNQCMAEIRRVKELLAK